MAGPPHVTRKKNLEKREYKSLTSLRGIFITIIAIFHVGHSFGQPFVLFEPIYNMGGMWGNFFFFMVSGFLSSLMFCKEDYSENLKPSIFFEKKILKWYPLYFLTNLLLFLHSFLGHSISEVMDIKRIVNVFLMIPTGWIVDTYPYNVPTWFLSVLLLCQFVFFGVAKLRKNHGGLYFVGIVVVALFGAFLLAHDYRKPFLYNSDGEGLLNFFIGVAIFELINYLQRENKKRMITIFSGVSILVLLVIIILSFVIGFTNILRDYRFTISLLVLPFMLYLSVCFMPLVRLLEVEPLVWVGRICLYVFMLHIPLQILYDNLVRYVSVLGKIPGEASLIIFIAVLYLVSYISYILMEHREYTKEH